MFFKKYSPQVLEILLTAPLIEYLHELLHQRAGKRVRTAFQRHTVNRPMQNPAFFFGLLRVLGQFLVLCDIGIDALSQRTVLRNQGRIYKAPALLKRQVLLSLDWWSILRLTQETQCVALHTVELIRLFNRGRR